MIRDTAALSQPWSVPAAPTPLSAFYIYRGKAHARSIDIAALSRHPALTPLSSLRGHTNPLALDLQLHSVYVQKLVE